MSEVSTARDDNGSVNVTARTKIRRFPPRGHYDKRTIWGILDKAVVAHVGFIKDETPAMLPMIFFRRGDYVYFHGAQKNRMFGSFAEHPEVCLTATVIDGFVAARAALHHSMNYRSVIIYGAVEEIVDPVEKMGALKGLIERFYPNRWDKIRQPSPSEFSRVSIYRLPIHEASAKIRNSFPAAVADELTNNVWAGVIPIETRMGMPILDPSSNPDTALNQNFSRIAEILRPSGDANKLPGSPAMDYPAPAQLDQAPQVAEAQADQSEMPKHATTPQPQAKTVAIEFTLADGTSRTVSATPGMNLMEAAVAEGVHGIVAECGGSMACGTCHVYVDRDWVGRIPRPSAGENSMLDFVEGDRLEGSRLSCQIAITEDMEGFRATVPAKQR